MLEPVDKMLLKKTSRQIATSIFYLFIFMS